MSRNNADRIEDPFEFVKDEADSIKLFVDLTSTANSCEFKLTHSDFEFFRYRKTKNRTSSPLTQVADRGSSGSVLI